MGGVRYPEEVGASTRRRQKHGGGRLGDPERGRAGCGKLRWVWTEGLGQPWSAVQTTGRARFESRVDDS